jgi:hypothetical protein
MSGAGMFRLKKIRLKISSKVALSFVVLVLLQGIVTLIALTLIVSRTQNDSFKTQMNRAVLGIEGYLQEMLDEQMINANLLAGQAKVIDYTDFGLKNLLRRELSVYSSSLQMDSLGVYSQPITVALNNLVNTSTGVKEYNVDMAGAIIAGIPTLLVYIISGKYFVRGLTAGSVKA